MLTPRLLTVAASLTLAVLLFTRSWRLRQPTGIVLHAEPKTCVCEDRVPNGATDAELSFLDDLPPPVDSRPILFMHIPKTAGTSVLSFLYSLADESLLGPRCARFDLFFVRGAQGRGGSVAARSTASPRNSADRDNDGDLKSTTDRSALPAIAARARNCSLIAGHFDTSFARVLGPGAEPQIVTFLRHPLQRFLSSFRFDLARGFGGSLLDYARAYPSRHVCNYQTRQIAGAMPPSLLEPSEMPRSDEELLAAAKANLQRFAFVGLTERADESMALMARALGLMFSDEDRLQHVLNARRASLRRPLDGGGGRETATANALQIVESSPQFEQARACILATHQLDLELYEYAQWLFERQRKRLDGEDGGEGQDDDDDSGPDSDG